jgi:hypothetical protein
MLPALLTSPKKAAVAGVTALLIGATAAAPAMAWGDREQQFLAGAAAALFVQSLIRTGSADNKPVYHYQQPAPIYYSQPTVSIYQTPTAYAFNSYSSNERRRIQSTLTAYGYYHSSIDGSFGPNTYNATVSFANATGKSGMLSTQAGAYALYDGLLF